MPNRVSIIEETAGAGAGAAGILIFALSLRWLASRPGLAATINVYLLASPYSFCAIEDSVSPAATEDNRVVGLHESRGLHRPP